MSQEYVNLQGASFAGASEDELRDGLEKAFDYRGDVTVVCKDGTRTEGYIFDRRNGLTLADSLVRIIPAGQQTKMSISYAQIANITFSGRDTAAGKSWEAWVRKYREKKALGEQNIEIEPEALD